MPEVLDPNDFDFKENGQEGNLELFDSIGKEETEKMKDISIVDTSKNYNDVVETSEEDISIDDVSKTLKGDNSETSNEDDSSKTTKFDILFDDTSKKSQENGSETSKEGEDRSKTSKNDISIEDISKTTKNDISIDNISKTTKEDKRDNGYPDVVSVTKCQDIRNFFFKTANDISKSTKRHFENEESDSQPIPKKVNLGIDKNDVTTNGFHDVTSSVEQSKSSEKQPKESTVKQSVSATKTVDPKVLCERRKATLCLRRLEETEHFTPSLKEDLEKWKLTKKTEGLEYEVEAVVDYSWCKLTVKLFEKTIDLLLFLLLLLIYVGIAISFCCYCY